MRAARGNETILIVEDEELVRRVACTMLGRRGYRILVASTGQEALELAGQHGEPIHLLLTDLVMPQLGGRELAEQFRSLRPEARVLFMSGYTGETAAHLGLLELGAFLQKPFSSDGLATKVREVLDVAEPVSATP